MSAIKLKLEGKTAFVSGANRGIGKAITEELLNNGIEKLYAGARNTTTLAPLVATYGAKVIPVELDVTSKASIEKATSAIDTLDILVNNAGVFSIGKVFSDEAETSLEENFNVNVWGVLHLSKALISLLKKEEETAIVNISSVAGLANMPMCATYSVSKAAVHSITQAMRGELVDTNTLVMGVYPGPIDTDMAADLEMPKGNTKDLAVDVVNGLMNGSEDVYPDAMAKEVGSTYAENPKAIEQSFGTFA
ncbi:SDR family NAD(P)-dependent oxidoreductase [Wenyingzhuangia sp. IMCC45574]